MQRPVYSFLVCLFLNEGVKRELNLPFPGTEDARLTVTERGLLGTTWCEHCS